jgi:hypothetical protein
MADNMLEHTKTIEIGNIKPQQSGGIQYDSTTDMILPIFIKKG